MDNLILEKIWFDGNPSEDLFQIKIIASNNRITMSSEVYTQSQKVIEFQHGIKNIIKSPFLIVFGNDDDSFLDCTKFSLSANKRGIVTVLIYMKSCADENNNDTAKFTILTDVASLDRFSSELTQLIDGEIGVKVRLHY